MSDLWALEVQVSNILRVPSGNGIQITRGLHIRYITAVAHLVTPGDSHSADAYHILLSSARAVCLHRRRRATATHKAHWSAGFG